MPMTQRDCFQATVAHEPHRGVLFYASFTRDLARRVREDRGLDAGDGLAARFGMFAPRGVRMKPPENLAKPDFSSYFADMEIPEGAFIDGLGILEVPHGFYHFTQYVSPLRNARRIEELEAFPYPHVRGYTSSHMAAEVEAAHAAGRVAALGIGHMYENAWEIRGQEPFLVDMIERPAWCELILDRLAERNRAVAVAAAEAGCDLLTCGDDVANQRAMMFSVAQWRRFMKPRWAEVFAAARAVKPDIEIKYHSDGNIEAVIGELIEIGVTILNPVQPECLDPRRVKAQWGDRLVLDGTLGTQSTMPFGTPDDVRRVVRENVRTLGADGALILAPTHVLEPEVPLENVYAFIETAREFGEVV